MSITSIVCVPIVALGFSYTPASSSAAVLGSDLEPASVSASASQGPSSKSQSGQKSASQAAQRASAWRARWNARLANKRGFGQGQAKGRIFGPGGGGVLPPAPPQPVSQFLP